ncbi:hypothetical protein HMPREF0083_03474 [Aneurinibacillus aneurinilyticus ATCC 12856]|uniref:Uncharacterized protein n=1 Tax=Aneurinibacillus aneurinilyticus ATCC 12856 TaxID=649747 RepID=U1Y8F8_ANEAE|nr:hypothetical protein HMPREF0083_03474 [Aneurinibacillus aneurinilyticus ATCC 12856]
MSINNEEQSYLSFRHLLAEGFFAEKCGCNLWEFGKLTQNLR